MQNLLHSRAAPREYLGGEEGPEDPDQPRLMPPMDKGARARIDESMQMEMPKSGGRETDKALEMAEALQGHGKLDRVIYPGHGSHPQHDLVKRDMGAGGTVIALDVTLD